MPKLIASHPLHCAYFSHYFLSSVLVFSAADNLHHFHHAVLSMCFKRVFSHESDKIESSFFNINLEASTPSLLPIAQSFYETLLGSHADRANKEKRPSEGAGLLAVQHQRWSRSDTLALCLRAVFMPFIHMTLFFFLSLSLAFVLFFFPFPFFFILPLCFKEDLFCVIEEGKRGQSIQPRVGARILSQPPCRSPVMS